MDLLRRLTGAEGNGRRPDQVKKRTDAIYEQCKKELARRKPDPGWVGALKAAAYELYVTLERVDSIAEVIALLNVIGMIEVRKVAHGKASKEVKKI
jgi:hypothetical protein